MEPRIRPVERDDAFALAALRVQQDRERGLASREGFLREFADAFLADFGSYRGWLAEQTDGDPLGCLLLRRVPGLPTLAGPGRPEQWQVQQDFVCPTHRSGDLRSRLAHTADRAALGAGARVLAAGEGGGAAPSLRP